MSQINTEIEKQLFELNYSSANNDKKVLYSWVYYNKNDDLCVLTNEKSEFMIKDRMNNSLKLIKNDAYFIKFVDKHITERIYYIKDELEYIKKSQDLYNKSNEMIKHISKEICKNYSLTIFDTVWLIKNNDKNYLKISIDMYKFIIKLTNYQSEFDTEIIISPKKLKTFLNLNKSRILQVIKDNNKLHKVKMAKNKKNSFEKQLQELQEKKENSHELIISHDATRKVGSRFKNQKIYIKKSLKERYETQACKPFPEKYLWNTSKSC
jgi:hypothetical protein